MKQTSYIELSKSALKKNIKYLKKRIGKEVKYVSVVKGNAYGHGIEEFVPIVEECNVDYFAVFDAYEAYRVNSVKRKKSDIMIMGMIDNDQLEWAIENDISFYVFELDRLSAAIETAKKMKKPARIHIEIETGLHRTGFENEELNEVISSINENSSFLHIEGICSHYAGAESVANYLRISRQYDEFNRIVKVFRDNGINPRYEHTACSAAALTYAHTRMDMVRFGIAQYGFWSSKETRMHNLLSDDASFTKDPLRRVLKWKSSVMSVKSVPAGDFISYGNSFLTTRKTDIATVPVGYFHGYRRSLSNNGFALVKGKKAPIIGNINMNMLIINVSSIPNVKKGDEVVIIGEQGSQDITVTSFCDVSNLVNYELLARLPAQIPRYVVDDTSKGKRN